MRLTGMDVGENQARRLLNDIETYRATSANPAMPLELAAHEWLATVFEPVIAAIPPELGRKLEPAQVFHEFLETSLYLAQQAGHDLPLDEVIASYVEKVLPTKRDERSSSPRRATPPLLRAIRTCGDFPSPLARPRADLHTPRTIRTIMTGFPRIYAHRGASSSLPRTPSPPSPRRGRSGRLRVRVRCRCHRRRTLIVIHDDTLDRTTSGEGGYYGLTYSDIRKLDAGRWFSDTYRLERIPEAADVISFANGQRMGMNLEIKPCYGGPELRKTLVENLFGRHRRGR